MSAAVGHELHAAPALTTGHHHGWYPISPCASGCVDDAKVVAGRVLVALRLIRLFLVMATIAMCAFVIVPMPRLARRGFIRRSARMVIAALGMTVEFDDRRPFAGSARGLLVANHISFLDVFAVATVTPSHFVAKSEVAAIPVISTIARRVGVIPIERASLRLLPNTLDVAVERLHQDSTVAVFPEGTTRCGQAMGAFRPAFFQAAIDARVPVIPVRLTFTVGGATATAASFIGDDSLVDTLRRVLRMRGLTVTVRMHEPQLPGTDRRELARRCERIIAGHGEPAVALAA
ncbi:MULTISPECIES: 1-acyl-sn-glycerol-3-phosphate acyltransferase [unclassified Gordonia (in: high G+C Gram-positive bacteria)]|uniref:lysophospholipid acyltransferase family protein n=1 Tax=unclassified Gordonia (in: high G+C Gram-positive bacteria) TaxID=2657482 RepID=UPI001F10D32C|nr:lysophospholipid acyltransferase family protein [Gordonia sp. ABSL49_1]MCH5643011.1 1-acyl-sn-glycerol-3-phosphate acyltransferase [Gordonia sp. ABSL49_1]